jgi:hypothetical protein
VTLMKEMFLNHLYGGVDEPEQKIIDVFSARQGPDLSRKLAHAVKPSSGRASNAVPHPTWAARTLTRWRGRFTEHRTVGDFHAPT